MWSPNKNGGPECASDAAPRRENRALGHLSAAHPLASADGKPPGPAGAWRPAAPETGRNGRRLGAGDRPSAVSTAVTAASRDSCSQTRTTSQPAAASAASAARSRSTLRRSLGSQYQTLFAGLEPWSGQACQKQPSTKTATRRAVNAMSGRTRLPSARSSRWSLRNRYPWACRARRSAISGLVSVRRLARMLAERPSLDGRGYSATGLSVERRRPPPQPNRLPAPQPNRPPAPQPHQPPAPQHHRLPAPQPP